MSRFTRQTELSHWDNVVRRPIAGWYDPSIEASVVVCDDGSVQLLGWGDDLGVARELEWCDAPPVPGSPAVIQQQIDRRRIAEMHKEKP